MANPDFEKAVKACYSTWSKSYVDEYYGPNAYPPVHVALIQELLRQADARSVLDAGCGPASILRQLDAKKMDLYGFDLTPEMVLEARAVMEHEKVPADHLWEGSVLQPAAFRRKSGEPFDATLCTGVFPHIPASADAAVIENLRDSVRPGGLVVLEARNQLFSLFTLNRYSYEFFRDELIRLPELERGSQPELFREAVRGLERMFRTDLPPVRTGKVSEPGYDEVLSRTHNPLVLQQQFTGSGFRDVQLLFYHYHCLPPMFESGMREEFRARSIAAERPDDWRGYFMASAFLLAGKRA